MRNPDRVETLEQVTEFVQSYTWTSFWYFSNNHFITSSSGSIVNFEQVNIGWNMRHFKNIF